MSKKMKSTIQEFIDSLSLKELKKYEDERWEFLLSELILAAMERDNISVRKLAKLAGVSPTIVQSMRSGSKSSVTMQSFFKVLRGLGGQRLILDIRGQYIPLPIPNYGKK